MLSIDTARPRLTAARTLAGLALAAVLACFAGLVVLRPPQDRLWGDEGTFVAMAASLVRDGDLAFTESDLAWLQARQPQPPLTLILQQTERGITYSKPVVYPLLSAPLFALLGEWGLIVTNLVCLGAAGIASWGYLRRLGPPPQALWTLVTFLLCSVLPAYVGWKMSDSMLASLSLLGLVLVLARRSAAAPGADGRGWLESRLAALVGSLALGAAVASRFPTAALVAAAVLALVLDGRLRRALLVAATAAVAFVAVGLAGERLTGTFNPYKASRTSFNQATGYPVGAEAERALERFTSDPATQSAGWRPRLDIRRTAYSSLYFFMGRHTGLLFYFPAALVLLLHLLARPDRSGLAMLAGAAAIVGFYLVWMPHNYFGGSTFLGNRYFLGAYPALLAGLRRLPGLRLLAIAWVLAVAAWSSALWSVAAVRELDRTSQSHTRAGIFRRLPFETTAQKIDGVEDRYWDRDYLRFVDPFARVAPWSFRLDSRRPAAELLLATDWPAQSMVFLVAPDTDEVRFELRDAGGRQVVALPRPAPEPRGLIEVPIGPAWRRHSLWWRPDRPYALRLLRLRLRAPEGRPATAVVRYLGRGRELAPLAARLLDDPLPSAAVAGTATRIEVRLENLGRRPWQSQALLPIRLGYRLIDPDSEQPVSGERLALPRRVRPHGILRQTIEIRWPEAAGDYRLELELVREPAAALGEHGRLLVAARPVRVAAALSPDSPEP